MEILHTEKRNGFDIEITYDEYSDSPAEWGNFTLVQFRDRDLVNFGDLDEYLTENGKLRPEWRAKLKSGKAFAFDYSRYSNTDGGFYRYPRSDVATGEIDTSDLNGLIMFEDEYVKGVSYEDRKAYAESDLKTYTQWANGEVYSVNISEDGETIDGCGGNIGDLDDIIADAQATVDRLTPARDATRAPRASSLHL